MKKLAFLLITLISLQIEAFASPTPELIVKTFNEENFDLKEKQGKVVLVHFWTSWCPNCRKEVLILNEVYQEYRSQGLEIIGLSLDNKKDRKSAVALAKTLPYQNAIIHETKKNNFGNVEYVPTSFVIDKKGNLASKMDVGNRELTKKDFLDVLLPLLRSQKK